MAVLLIVAALATTIATSTAVAASPRPFTGLACSLTFLPRTATLGQTDRRVFSTPSTGRVKAIMLFADTRDGAATSAESTRRIYGAIATPAIKGFRASSNGRFRLVIDAYHRWLRVPGLARDYNTMTFAGQRALLTEAALKANAHIDFSQYKIIYVVQSRRSARINSPAFIASSARFGIGIDGTVLRAGATFGADARANDNENGAWILMHETTHTLGMPDLYEIGGRPGADGSRFVGWWDLMGSLFQKAGFSQWTRRKLGWLPARNVVCLRRAGAIRTLNPQAKPGGTQLIIVPTGASTAVTVEQRAQLGIDATLCDSGVVVSRINSTTRSGRGPMRVVAARSSTLECGTLGRAAFARGVGERCSTIVDGIRIEVLSQAHDTSRVRVVPARMPADPRVARCR